MDAYRSRNSIVLWIKTCEENLRVEMDFAMFVYMEASKEAERFLKSKRIDYILTEKQTYLRKWKRVFAIRVPVLSEFEGFVKSIERGTRHRIPLYNADIAPEQMFLQENNLLPCGAVEFDGKRIVPIDGEPPALTKIEITVLPEEPGNGTLKSIIVDGKRLEGDEKSVLRSFADQFMSKDADIVVMDYAFSTLPYLARRLETHKIECPFHRYDPLPINYRGGKSFFSYGRVYYRDFAIRLHGRFLVDSSTAVGGECETDAIIELCQLSGACFQQIASRSFGAVFQTALVRQMVRSGFLVPFKEKPIDRPFSMAELLKCDRAGHTFDPKIGFHQNVAEIDFCSMYPWLIYNHNISADTILSESGPFETVPGINVRASLRHKGLAPVAIKPILDRRMEYKRNPTAVNIQRATGLKKVLVTCYGYLRFREFKLGIASSHMAICAYAREIMIAAAHLAEEQGFELVHGIVDSLYIKAEDLTEEKVLGLCSELEMITGIPVSFEGIFRWVVFLPSINDDQRPVPARYFGVFRDGKIKARGIELRSSGAPMIVKHFQQKALESMSSCTRKEIAQKAPLLCSHLREIIKSLPELGPEWLMCSLSISKTMYSRKIPQREILRTLRGRGVAVAPGQTIRFVFQKGRVVLPEDYNGNPDTERYKRLLIRSLHVLLQPFGFSRNDVVELSSCERQAKLTAYYKGFYD